jgi:hypothetical protein
MVDAILFSNKWLRFDFQGGVFFCSCAAVFGISSASLR